MPPCRRNVAAPGWYDALTARTLSAVADGRVSAFGSVESHNTVRSRRPATVCRRGFSPPWARVAPAILARVLVEADGEYALAVYDPAPKPDGGVLALMLRPAWWVGARVTSWSPCGPGYRADRAACVPWSRAFNPADVH